MRKLANSPHEARTAIQPVFHSVCDSGANVKHSALPGAASPANREGQTMAEEMDEHQQRDIAAQKILEAMQAAIDAGVSPDVVKLVTLSAAVTNFVNDYGEEATAGIIETLPEKVRNGAFSQPARDGADETAEGADEEAGESDDG